MHVHAPWQSCFAHCIDNGNRMAKLTDIYIYIYIIKYTYTHIYTRHGHRYNFLLFNTIAFTTKIGVCLLCLWFYIFSCSCLSAAWNIDECMHVTATNARNHLTSHELRKPKSMYGCRGPWDTPGQPCMMAWFSSLHACKHACEEDNHFYHHMSIAMLACASLLPPLSKACTVNNS